MLFARKLGIVGVFAAVSFLGGCLDAAGIERFRNDLAGVRQDLADREVAWQMQIDRLKSSGAAEGDPVLREARAGLAEAGAARAATDAALARLDQVVADATSPTSDVGRTVGVVAPLLPGPVQAPLLLGSALLLALARAWQMKRGLVSVVEGIRRAMNDDESFAARFREHANTFRITQTPAAQRIVNEVKRDSLLARLPI